MSNICILIGVSGTGKTTVAQQIAEVDGVLCSTDKFIEEEAKKLGISYQKCMDNIQKEGRFKDLTTKFYDEIDESIKLDKNIIID